MSAKEHEEHVRQLGELLAFIPNPQGFKMLVIVTDGRHVSTLGNMSLEGAVELARFWVENYDSPSALFNADLTKVH